MLKRKEIETRNSCLNKAADDEPIFVLKSTDELAPWLVETWAAGYVALKGGFDKMSARQRQKYAEARELAAQMRKWRALSEDRK